RERLADGQTRRRHRRHGGRATAAKSHRASDRRARDWCRDAGQRCVDDSRSEDDGARDPPPAEPKVVTVPPPKKEIAPVPNVTASPIRIVARHGDHGTYTRLAIDWPSKIGYRVTREGDRTAITFTAPANIDLGPARKDLPQELVQIAAIND